MKNKLAPPFKTVQFELEFGKGICKNSEIIDLGLKHKFITKAGAMYYYGSQSACGKEAFKRFLNENENIREELVIKIREKLLTETQKKPELEEEVPEGRISNDSTDEEATALEA